MTVDEISYCAMGDMMPPGELTMPEELLWYRLRDIYAKHRSGLINAQSGAILKHEAVAQYDMDKKTVQSAERIVAWHGKWWKEIEIAAKMYTDNPCVQTADVFFSAVYHARRKERESLLPDDDVQAGADVDKATEQNNTQNNAGADTTEQNAQTNTDVPTVSDTEDPFA